MNPSYLKVLSFASLVIFLYFPSALANEKDIRVVQGGGVEILHYEQFPGLELFKKGLDPSTLERHRPAWEWSIDAFGKHFQFDLERNDRLIAKLPKAQRDKLAAKYELYRGKIDGIEDSWIRLTKIGEEWSGMIWDGQEVYIIDPMKFMMPSLRTIPSSPPFKQGIYRLSDVKNLGNTACGVEGAGRQDAPLSDFRALSDELQGAVSAEAVGASLSIDLAIVADPLFAQIQQNTFGTSTDAAVIARVNVVDGIYSEQVGVQINLVEIVQLSSNGTLTATDSGTLLTQFGNFTNSSQFNHPGVAHLFTGRNIDGNTIGRAYIGTLCHPRYGVGINEIRQGGTIGSILFAHELGHNFNAPHDNQSGSPCASTPGDFIMSPVINNSQDFSQCSIDQMQPEINSATCITQISSTGTDVSLTLPGSPLDAPVGSLFNYEIEVHNTGPITADNVNGEVNVSSGLSILNAAVNGSLCSITSGTQANCFLGNIPSGQHRTMTLSLQGGNPGQETVTAQVAADNDQNSSNNSAQATINLTNTDPSVTISSPQNGGFLPAGSSIAFTGKASDIEDGNLTARLVWISDLVGEIGRGGSFSTQIGNGTHRITASVTDNGGAKGSAVVVITIADGLDGPILFESHFNNGADGFAYVDDTFRNTTEPTYASGSYEANQGFSGGGVRVFLGGINNNDITDMSGGWARSFNLGSDADVTVALRYKLSQASEYESDELSQALLGVDGVLYGTSNNDYLAQIVGNGSGGSVQTTGWVPVVINLGTLAGGSHTLSIGAYNNKKTYNDETTEVLIDDVGVRATTTSSSPPPPPPSSLPAVTITSPSDGQSFSKGTSIAFAGQASDGDDGNLTSALVWRSNKDGVIGTQGAFSTSTLSAGQHDITASVTDSDGNEGSDIIRITIIEPTDNSIVFEAHFNAGPDNFVYVDDAFRNTNQPNYATGTHEPAQGFSGGGLRVMLGGINGNDIFNMSGGWSRSFNLANPGDVTVDLRYQLIQASEYESDELSQALLAVDGTLVGVGNNDFLAQITGNGNGGSVQTTGWVSVVINLWPLGSGSHTLTIGSYNNKKTFTDETTEVLIDDVVVRSSASGPPPPLPGNPIIDASFDGGNDGFTYTDDAFRSTNQPTYASGSHVGNQGFSGGGLQVLLGGINNNDILNMSGGWSRSFTLTEARTLTLTFRYHLTQDGNYESDEFSEALLALDGQLRGNAPNQSLVRITGNGEGGPDLSTGWVSVTESLGTLQPGSHTITIGGYNNKKTYNNEVTELLIDDVRIE